MRPPPRRVLTASTGTIHNTNPNTNNISTARISNIAHKRKERDESFVFDEIKTKSSPSTMQAAGISGISKPNATSRLGSKRGTANAFKGSDPDPSLQNNSSKQILVAGYLAHEFLSKGTLLGQVWNPTRPERNAFGDFNAPVSSDSKSSRQFGGEEVKTKPVLASVQEGEDQPPVDKLKKGEDGQERYEEVSNLLKAGGAQLPGIINPSQLGRFLQL